MNTRDGDQHRIYTEDMHRSLQAMLAHLTQGLSPTAFMLAFHDWLSHLSSHPAKQQELLKLLQSNLESFSNPEKNEQTTSRVKDRRFADESWNSYPYNIYRDSFLSTQEWWKKAASGVNGVARHHEEMANFALRQVFDTLSPTNLPFLNPEVQQASMAEQGQNFFRGMQNFLDDLHRQKEGKPPFGAEHFSVGKNMALTEGKVIYRNHLIELIQYAPVTKEVYAEPILITPAWIMKYYILDLAPKYSLAQHLVSKGHTVFMISWRNPGEKDRNLSMDDYLNQGIMASIDAINSIVPRKKIHLAGYCLGGTLAAIAAATMAKNKDNRLKSLTLFAAQTDFSEPGELGLFIDESQISALEEVMAEKGYLDTYQMAGAFQLLRSNDLVWSKYINDYLLGQRKPMNDLMAWNADATRLPYRMHSEYLRNLYLNNQLARGKYSANGKLISLKDIHIPIFVVATERDHVAPWQSVYKINLLTNTKITFALTSGGHNMGIVSMPLKNVKRYYRLSTFQENFVDADTWFNSTKPRAGSWWSAWDKWLEHQPSKMVKPPKMGNAKAGLAPLVDAPGTYVKQK